MTAEFVAVVLLVVPTERVGARALASVKKPAGVVHTTATVAPQTPRGVQYAVEAGRGQLVPDGAHCVRVTLTKYAYVWGGICRST